MKPSKLPMKPWQKYINNYHKESYMEEPKYKKLVEGANDLSLGISMVVAVLLGVGIGIGLRNLTGIRWTFWIGIFIGIAAAILNVYKAYAKQKKSLDALANDPKYSYKKNQALQKKYDDEDDDEIYS